MNLTWKKRSSIHYLENKFVPGWLSLETMRHNTNTTETQWLIRSSNKSRSLFKKSESLGKKSLNLSSRLRAQTQYFKWFFFILIFWQWGNSVSTLLLGSLISFSQFFNKTQFTLHTFASSIYLFFSPTFWSLRNRMSNFKTHMQ